MMIIIVMLSLFLGIAVGQMPIPSSWVDIMASFTTPLLYILMFSVGISVGLDKLIFRKMRELSIRILLVPLGTVFGSIIGGIITAIILKMNIFHGVIISSGLGWYSLSGVLATKYAGETVGTITFMCSILREVLAFLFIPFVARFTNKYAVVSVPGATSSDTTLPAIIKYTSKDIVIVSVISGLTCAIFVPIIINFVGSRL